ncbi:Spc98 family protein [Dendryphion nanum]|uniref:Spindle pole body component n=1 Tax=Dendryphion nanum TaxID=256645 RepID=A0A9P9IC00_9PLEO|nr:Spc98 family protein [Dendryphion nanum]
MLHEILLSLSGHPSALFDAPQKTAHVTSAPLSLLSPPEAELLSSIANLSRLHRETRHHVVRIAASHPSTICRAVATAITSHHLDKFQCKVLEVESRILKQDASAVGAYNIVPLAGIVGEFSEWTKLMEWLWHISIFISDWEGSGITDGIDKRDPKTSSGAELINKLRTEAQTGYPDIEEAALHLGAVAETSWMRQLSSWLLYGRLPTMGASDFFISADDEDDLSFVINHTLLPKFVTRQTATSMLFVGKSLNQIRSLSSSAKTLESSSSMFSELNLLPKHVSYLSGVIAPISSAKLSGAVASIRLSLSQNLLQHLLPKEKIIEILTVLHQFFLLGRGEFAVVLIAEADDKMQSRHKAPVQSKPGQGIQGILLKEGEINNTLTRSWSVLSSLGGEDDHTDDALDVANDIVHLSVQQPTSNRPGTPGRARESSLSLPILSNIVFSNLMFSIPTLLTMDLRSPLDLFMTKSDLEVYSSINAYLLAVRRAHIHLAHLWRQSTIRREHPPPPNYEHINSPHGKALMSRRRQRIEARSREMRKVWATCAAAIFFLSESEAYFQGEVVQESFKHFLHWVAGRSDDTTQSTEAKNGPDLDTSAQSPQLQTGSTRQHDPETLSFAHRHFLSSISYSLLLTDHAFTQILRDFFTHVDELVAYIDRLQLIRQNLDLEEDGGAEDFMANYQQDEKDVALQLDRSRRRLDSDLKSLIARLRDLDSERVGSGPGLNLTREEDSYEPLRVGGVDRLLMKLDWGGTDDEDDTVENLL